jgi:hypothetical protein
VTVSGRITATLPFPAAAIDDRAVMAEKSLVRLVAEMEGAAAEELVLPLALLVGGVLEELPLLLQAAASRQAAAGSAMTAALRLSGFLEGITKPPRVLAFGKCLVSGLGRL